MQLSGDVLQISAPSDLGIAQSLFCFDFLTGRFGGIAEGPPRRKFWSGSLVRPRFFPFIDVEAGENVMKGTIPWLSHRCGCAFVAGKFILVR